MGAIHPIETRHGVIYIEVTEGDAPLLACVREPGAALPEGAEPTGTRDYISDALKMLRTNIIAVASEINEAIADTSPEEWAVEINIGFKGKTTPIPVIVSGAAEASLKVTAKWKKT
jgi:hypothetical protein